MKHLPFLFTIVCAATVAQSATTLPAGYTRLAYLESTGTQYIDTGLAPTKNFRVVVDMAWTSPKNTGGFGYASATSSKEQSFRLYARTVVAERGTTEFRVNVNDHYGRFNTLAIPTTNDTARHIIDLSNTRKSIDGVLFGDTSGLTKTLQSTFYLFAIRYSWSPYIGQYGLHRLHSCRLYEGTTLKRDFIPCTNANGDAGLYDLVGATMYLNGGTGDFVCGPAASETLDVAPLPFAMDGASPAQGLTTGLAAGDSFVCSVPAACTNAAGDTAATCTGYVVYTNGVVYMQGAGPSFTYTHPAHEAGARLEWQWDVEYRIDAEAFGGTVSPATQWVAAGASSTVALTPDAESAFTRWTSSSRSVTFADATANPATFTANGPATLTASCVTLAGPLQAELATTGYQGIGTLTNFPVLVRVSTTRIPGFSYADCAPDGSDIAFALADGTILPHEIDTWNPAGESLVWVRLPEVTPVATSFLFQWRGARGLPNDPTAVWRDDYVAVWHMNTIDANGDIPDATGHGYNAHTSSVAQVTSASGTCIVGPAVQVKAGRLDIADYEADFPDAAGVFTASGWFSLPGKAAGWHKILGKKIANGDTAQSITGWLWEMNNNLTTINFIRKSGAKTGLTIPDVSKNWNHFATASSGSKIRSYVNGVNISSGNYDVELVPGGKPMAIMSGVVNGIADEFRIRRGPPPASDYWFQAEYCTAKDPNFVTCGAVRPAGPAFSCDAVDSGETSVSAGWRVPFGTADIYAAWGASADALDHTNLLVAAASGAGTNTVSGLPAAAVLYISFFAEANGLRTASTPPYLFATRDAASANDAGPALLITGTNRVDGAITSLHVVFGPVPPSTILTLLAASGTSDGHGDLAAWDNFKAGSRISADVRECDVTMPATWGETEFYLRLFAAEGLVQPYDTRVEYVLSSQEQHFVTPFVPTPRTCISADLAFTEVETLQQRVFSAESSSIVAPQFEIYVNASKKISFAMWQTKFEGTATSAAGTARRIYEIDAYNRVCSIGNSSVLDISGRAFTMDAATNLTLLARYPSGSYRGGGKLYGARIKEAGVLVADYVPCVADGEAALCETLTGTILRPLGGALTAGPAVADPAPTGISSSATVTDLSDEPIVLFLEATPKEEGPVTIGWDLAYPGVAGDTAAIYVAWGYETNSLCWTNLVAAAAPAGVSSNDLSCFPSNRICHARIYAVNGEASELTDLLTFTTSTNAPGVAPRAPYIADGWALTGSEEGDTIHLAGALASMGGAASVAVFAEVSRAGDFSDAVVWPVATLSQPGAFALTLHTNDTASAAYIAPGSTVAVRLRAVAEAVPDDLTPPSQYTMRNKSTFGTISNTGVSNRTLTFTGKLSTLGMNTTEVWLFWSSTDGTSGSKLVTSFGPFDSVANQFSTTVAFPAGTYGETVTSYFVASNACSTAATSTKSASKTGYINDTATYTWKADSLGNWNGSWTDSAHWSSSVASSKCQGWPSAKGATAVFPASCTAEVSMASSSLQIATLNLSAKKLNLTFLGTGAGLTLVTSLPAGAVGTNRYDSVLVFDNVALNVTASKYYLPVGGGSIFELRHGSTLTCPYLSIYGTGGKSPESHFIIRQGCSAYFSTSVLLGGGGVLDVFGSLSMRYNIWIAEGGGGGRLVIHETADSVVVPEYFQLNSGVGSALVEVLLPVGGFPEIPLQRGNGTKRYFAYDDLASTGTSAIRFHVSGPVRHETEEVAYPILYWDQGINTNRVDLSDPGSPRGELYYTWRNSSTGTTGTGLPTYIWYRQKRPGGTVILVQ